MKNSNISHGWFDSVLFDLDGTLVDSERVYFPADVIFLERYGITYSDDLRPVFMGMGARGLINWMRERKHIDRTDEELYREKDDIYLELARRDVKPFPEVILFARALHGMGKSLSIVSGSTRRVIDETLAMAGISDIFTHRVSSMSVERGKPHPDVFLKALSEGGFTPGRTIAVEDSRNGVLSALAAGLVTVALPELSRDAVLSDSAFDAVSILIPGGGHGFSSRRVLDALADPVRERRII